jgi:uncharacterized membrane protein YgdD (TMEM256/DUF423 family)
MNKEFKRITITALVLLILGIILGAFGAHGLKGKVSVEKIASFEVGVRYQMINAIGLLALASLRMKISGSLRVAFLLVLLGVILFSGSIYGLTFQPNPSGITKVLGPITPLGGLLMIIGWIVVLWRVMKTSAVS